MLENPPTFSVVTVVRNDLPGLRRTWKSLESQTNTDWEWVVVDGASTDGTVAWLAALDDDRVNVRSEPDDGIYDAMNRGARRATGRLVTFLNAGDCLFDASVLDRVAHSYAADAWSWAYGRIDLLTPEGKRAGAVTFDPFSLWQLRMGRQAVPHPGAFFSAGLMATLADYRLDYPVVADQEFMLRAARLAPPASLALDMVRFELGGTSSRSRPDEWIREARRARGELGIRLAPPAADALVTMALSWERKFRLAVFRLRAARRVAASSGRPTGAPAPATGEFASAPAGAGRIDVLVVHYLNPELTKRAVELIAGEFTTVWVWANSDDCPVLPRATVLGDGRNLLFAEANNRLYGHGSAEFVLLLNPDVTLEYATLVQMLTRLRQRPDVWGITPRLVGSDGRNQNYLHRLPTTPGLVADRLPPFRVVCRSAFRAYRCLDQRLTEESLVEQPPAAALLMRRRDIERAGGLFDPSYPLFFNDVDLGRRMRDQGLCSYAADLTAGHVGGASLRAAGKRGEPVSVLYHEALVTYARRHLTGWPLVLVAVRIRSLLDRLRGGWWA